MIHILYVTFYGNILSDFLLCSVCFRRFLLGFFSFLLYTPLSFLQSLASLPRSRWSHPIKSWFLCSCQYSCSLFFGVLPLTFRKCNTIYNHHCYHKNLFWICIRFLLLFLSKLMIYPLKEQSVVLSVCSLYVDD